MNAEQEPDFDKLSAFPPDAEPPPPKPWHRRLAGVLWRLFPATVVCIPLFGFFGFMFLGMIDTLFGTLGGLVIGAFIGFVIDVKHSLGGGTIDE